MTDYLKHKKKRWTWYSSPFYSALGGYKLCVQVIPYGDDDGFGSHVSLYLHMMKGEYDDKLQWPFERTVILKLLNQKTGQYQYDTMIFDSSDEPLERVTSQLQCANYGWGFSKFISHYAVESVTDTEQYIMNDTLVLLVAQIS